MNKFINEEGEKNLPSTRIPNNIHGGCFALKERKNNPPCLRCGLHRVTSFQKGVTMQWLWLAETQLPGHAAGGSKSTSAVTGHGDTGAWMRWDEKDPSLWGPAPRTHGVTRRNRPNSNLGTFYKIPDQSTSKLPKSPKTRKTVTAQRSLRRREG